METDLRFEDKGGIHRRLRTGFRFQRLGGDRGRVDSRARRSAGACTCLGLGLGLRLGLGLGLGLELELGLRLEA